MNRKTIYLAGIASLLLLVPSTYAGNVTIPNTFTSGTPAVAAQVNANFSAVKTAVDDNDGRVTVNASSIASMQSALTTLQDTVTQLQSDLTAANNTISTLQSQLSAVNNSEIMALSPYVTIANDSRGPIATFTGLNLQLVNGTGTTDGPPNGLGNLIIGYDVARSGGSSMCALGSYTDQTSCQNAGYTWGMSHKTGSHYLVIGEQNNYSQYGGLVSGYQNSSTGAYASVSGGGGNTASAIYASISGGIANTASGQAASASGGALNTASGTQASVSGGYVNTASGAYASISGGRYNSASSFYASVSGGINNTASATYASVSGGQDNTASGHASSVSGGGNGTGAGGNTASQNYSSILGGVGQTTTSAGQTIPALP